VVARSRNIKPGFFTNEYLADLSPHARLLFIGLWTIADREGRLENRPKRIQAALFPYENDVDVDSLLGELEGSPEKFVFRYSLGDASYVQITNWHRHQKPHVREADSIIPAYNGYQEKAVPEHNPGDAEAQPRSPSYLLPLTDSLNMKEDSPTLSFVRDIQTFTNREPYKSIQFKTAEYRNALATLEDLITEYGYEKVLQTAQEIHTDDSTAYSIFQFAWMIPARLKQPAKKCTLSQPFNRYAYTEKSLENCGCPDCLKSLGNRGKK